MKNATSVAKYAKVINERQKSLDYKLTVNESSMLPVKNNEYFAIEKRVQTKHENHELTTRKSWKIKNAANPIEGSTFFTVFETCFQLTNCIVNRIPTSCGRNNKQKSKFYFDVICCLEAPEKHDKCKDKFKKEF